jgi:hypothetical protein
MEVDGRFFQIMVSQEQLNGAQVSAVFEQVGSEAVAQGVGMYAMFEAGVQGSLLAGIPHCLRGDGMRGGMSAPAGEYQQVGLRFSPRQWSRKACNRMGLSMTSRS